MEISLTNADVSQAVGAALLEITDGLGETVVAALSTPEVRREMIDAVQKVITEKAKEILIEASADEEDGKEKPQNEETKNITSFPVFGTQAPN